MKCHLCEQETDFTCDRCGEPVCFDCCVKMTIHNQIDYSLCSLCGDVQQIARSEYYQKQEEEKELEQKLKKEKADKRRANYYKLQNIEKRRLAKIERHRIKREQMEQMLGNAVRIVNNWLK